MATAKQLRELAERLRHAPTRLLPIEEGERIQHLIVRIEGRADDASDAERDELTRLAEALLGEIQLLRAGQR